MDSVGVANPHRHLSKVEQYRIARQQEQDQQQEQSLAAGGRASGQAGSVMDKFGHQEKSGLGRIAMVVATGVPGVGVNTSAHAFANNSPFQLQPRPLQPHLLQWPELSSPLPPMASPSHQQLYGQLQQQQQQQQQQQHQQHQQQQQRFDGFYGNSSSGSPGATGAAVRNHNKRAVTTLEAKELQTQLESIRAMRDAEASFSNPPQPLARELHQLHQHQQLRQQQQQHAHHASTPAPAESVYSLMPSPAHAGGGYASRAQLPPPSSSSVHSSPSVPLHLALPNGMVQCACCAAAVPASVVAYVPAGALEGIRPTGARGVNRGGGGGGAVALHKLPRSKDHQLTEVRSRWRS